MPERTSHNLYQVISARFPSNSARPCIETPGGHAWSYAAVEAETARLANFLTGIGAHKGDRVAVQAEKSAQSLLLYLACMRAGLIYLPLNTAYREQELAYFLADAEPTAVVCAPEAAERIMYLGRGHGIRHVLTLDGTGAGSLVDGSRAMDTDFQTVACAAGDTAAILYTSGTTGRPKGAMLSHGNLSSNGLVLCESWGFTGRDVLLHALPIFHVHGLFVACHCALLGGAKMIFLPRFEVGEAMDQLPRATVFMGVPTYYTRFLAMPEFGRDHCRNMRLFVSGSAPLQTRTFAEFRKRTGHIILERYGMSETGMITSNPLHGERRAGTVGPPLPGVEVRIADASDQPLAAGEVGEIQLHGPNVFPGYWRMPEKTAAEFTADGFFKTGDLGSMDQQGYVSISGRSKDLIISGGYNIYPKELENCIDALDGIRESAVIGLPDADFGERVAAVIVPASAPANLSSEAIIATLKTQVANYKVPKAVFFLDELPRNAMGKVQKSVLRERFRDQP